MEGWYTQPTGAQAASPACPSFPARTFHLNLKIPERIQAKFIFSPQEGQDGEDPPALFMGTYQKSQMTLLLASCGPTLVTRPLFV